MRQEIDKHVRQAIEHIGTALQDVADGSGPGMTEKGLTALFDRARGHLKISIAALEAAVNAVSKTEAE